MEHRCPVACQSFSETEDYTLNVLGIPGLWTGLLGNIWHIAGNWDDGNVPDASTRMLSIPDGTPYDLISTNDDAYCNNITIEPGAYLSLRTIIHEK